MPTRKYVEYLFGFFVWNFLVILDNSLCGCGLDSYILLPIVGITCYVAWAWLVVWLCLMCTMWVVCFIGLELVLVVKCNFCFVCGLLGSNE